MKITPVNYSYNKSQSKAQNFKGLWGKTSRNTDYDAALGVPKVEDVYYYYPFSGEKKEEIEEVKNKYTSAYVENNSKYRVKDCRVCTYLPFTKADYDGYSSLTDGSKLTKDDKSIHSYVQDKYVNNEYGNNQTPAVNVKI